ncbi:uncharacterized protein TRAVEDRAFT_52736 [Trametes versicolor FP-101664 SS1]|uniref:uncharacterized protein n=1 Tax=Trametes versicolor (strain FP-101664) TaxID=717944 RepID=UPI0004621A0A|nr:uncharacterized protein TRAVEDRAFT_52736 [Trametes versicolor FP-101664 SS1]EIW53618.1 hypothetical protein TRAVEDRAFT_52736 [Trametes versicolor FP-101664 SS1]
MHAWHARSLSRPFCYREIVLTASTRNQRSHRDFTAVHVNLVLSMFGVGSSTLEGEHTTRSLAPSWTLPPSITAQHLRAIGGPTDKSVRRRLASDMKTRHPYRISINPRIIKLWPLPLHRARRLYLDTTVELLETCGIMLRPRYLRTTNTR